MKLKQVFLIVLLVLLIDQALKIYIKTHFMYNEEVNVLGTWFRLHFIENEGMAFGMKFGERYGKLALTLFRLGAVIWGIYFIQTTLIKKKYHQGLIFCSALILAGALGNLIDSVFYAKVFTESPYHAGPLAKLVPFGQGYGDLFHGRVVDMLYFPLIHGTFPDWMPIWGGQQFEFFRPVFNIADASISGGVIAIFVFQKTLLKKHEMEMKEEAQPVIVSHAESESEPA